MEDLILIQHASGHDHALDLHPIYFEFAREGSNIQHRLIDPTTGQTRFGLRENGQRH